MATVREGDRVEVRYTGRFPDGKVFDKSPDGQTLGFTAGGDEVIPGVSQAVIGMEEGATKEVEVPPEQGYGPHRPELVSRVPKEMLPDGASVGDTLQAQGDKGAITVWLREIEGEECVLDANHPLAGATLVFDLELVSVAADGAEEAGGGQPSDA